MKHSVHVHAEAEREMNEAADWYAARRAGLGQVFLHSLDHTVSRIGDNPLQFPVIGGQLRRAKLRRFPYNVIFDFDGLDVYVMAIAHGSRKPEYWRRRL